LKPPKKIYEDYFPLRQDDSPPITISMNAKSPLPIVPFLKSIRQYEDMLSKVANLKFMKHDIIKTQNFPKLARDEYMCTNIDPDIEKIP
jgi:hypothetical protein